MKFGRVKSKVGAWLNAAALSAMAAVITGPPADAANVMNYGADGNDYFQFTTPSMACDKASGFTTLITFAMHVDANGTLEIAGVACSNGIYVGPTNWGALLATLKSPPTTVTRYEVAIGGWEDTSYNNIESLVASQGTGPGSILYKNFQALKNAVPGIDAINDDDELTYDLNSSTAFANMLGGLGFKFTMVPYTAQSFWVDLYHSITNCDYIYLQCYEGGAGNSPSQWNSAFGGGVKVIPGQESNTANPATFASWYSQTGVQGGFYYPDVVFNTTYWSAAIIEANGAVPAAPTGVTAVAGGRQVSLSWNTVPGAISYNVKRSTVSGGETNVANVSTQTNPWPSSNQYLDLGLAANIAYYYKITAVNANGESLGSTEVSGLPSDASVFNFESPGIGAGNFEYDALSGPWTFTGASPNGSGLVADGSAFGNPNAPGTNTQAAFLQEDGGATRTLWGFVPGTNYTITFSAAERNGYNQSWNVEIDSRVIGGFNPGAAATSYTDYSASFTATASTHNLQFVGTDLAGGDNTVFIDDIRISPPLLPLAAVTTNTWPATAVDVVGGQITFTAGFASSSPVAYQWRLIKSGATNAIKGATNTTLNLSNLQLANTASYQLQASNTYGITLSAPASLTVNSVPVPANNVITACAAQTGLGGAVTNFVPTWSVLPGSLIAGQSPSSVGGGSFSEPNTNASGSISVLTDGAVGWFNYWPGVGGSTAEVAGGSGAGASVTYTLAGSAGGYDLTNITVYGGWGDAGRDEQAYTIYYSTVSAPSNFIQLSSVGYTPSDPAGVQSATRVRLTPSKGYLATNVAAVMFNFTTPAPENGYCGYSEIDVYGLSVSPELVTDTLPATAMDVVGSQVTFVAAVSSALPLNYQWQKISGGATNNIAGATSSSLVLTNLQPSDAASYQLEASNAYGVAYSTARPLTVTGLPAPVNNIVTACAAQTGLGGSSNNFYTTWAAAPGSLIAGLLPSSVGSGDFSDPINNLCGTVAVLTDGSFGYLQNIPGAGDSPTEVACGPNAGQSVTYTLPGTPYGYNLTNITVYGGWGDAGRDQQAYTIYYSTFSAPANFVELSAVNFMPPDPSSIQSATRATLTSASGYLATNVAAVMFDFTTPAPENGYCGYSEIQIFGMVNVPPAVPVGMTAAPAVSGSLVVNLSGLVIGRNYIVQCATNLTSPAWLPVTNFIASATSASLTNSIGGAGQMFFEVEGY